jgi:hypothetical protein
VTFADLSRRWAVDWRYGRSIEYVAQRYRKGYCTEDGTPLGASPDPAEDAPAREPVREAQPSQRRPLVPRLPAATEPRTEAPAQFAAAPAGCGIWSASYGGTIAFLIRSVAGAATNYTVLQVDADHEASQVDAFMRAHVQDGETLGRFGSPEQAFARAFELCPRPS